MLYYLLVILSVLAAAFAQILLKQGAREGYIGFWRQYLNPWVISGYAIMACSLVLNIFCMSHGVLIKEVSIIESLSYLFIPCMAFVFFHEKITLRKVGAIAIIISGVILFFL
jgi:drug/metabolite transporter (DMT)-like permease